MQLSRLLFVGKILLFYLIYSIVCPVQGYASVPTERDPFVVPTGLEQAVEFWKKIFLRHDSSELVFFDPKSFRIYEVMNVPQGLSVRRLVRFRTRQIRRSYGLSRDRIEVQRGVADHFAAAVRRSGRYLPGMREIFADHGLPQELTYLPFVESSFRQDARSFAGAVGIWQFMPGTARRFIRVTRHLDERKDPWEATRAAALLLAENYQVLETWPLAVTAYNHGQAGMARAVRQVGSRDIVEIIERYRSRTFKFASRNFYAEFLAAVHIMREVENHFPNIQYEPPLQLKEITLQKYVPIKAVLRHSGLTRVELLEWNPALSRRARWMPKGYRLKVDPENEDLLSDALARVKSVSWVPHQVSRGESLSLIASRYGTSVYDIQVINGITNVHRLRVGQELKIPAGTGRSARRRSTVRRDFKGGSWTYHRVRRGESLWLIARRYRVSVASLKRVNGISDAHVIRAGDRLRIRKGSS